MFLPVLGLLYLPPAAQACEPVNSRGDNECGAIGEKTVDVTEKIKGYSNEYPLILAPQTGLEPVTPRLTAACSAS